ncbi:MAG: hypothetical protein M0C28_18925 [Candidatus Moduliflexus flocculans]|nr:hypothetical protein [Candidatus Moduliflexus flocculans]
MFPNFAFRPRSSRRSRPSQQTRRPRPASLLSTTAAAARCSTSRIAEQLKSKRHLLKQALKRYTELRSGPDRRSPKTIGQKPPYGYRNKAQMPFSQHRSGLDAWALQAGREPSSSPSTSASVQEAVVNAANNANPGAC